MAQLLLWLLGPALAWTVVQVLVRIPRGPFLALTPARTPFGRALSVAVLLTGTLGIVTVLSLSSGPRLLIAAFVVAAVVVIGCGAAYATHWWPAALSTALVGMGLWFAWLPRLVPGAVQIDVHSAQAPILVVGGFALVMLALVSSTATIEALQAVRPPDPRVRRRKNRGVQLPGAPKRRRRSGTSRGRR